MVGLPSFQGDTHERLNRSLRHFAREGRTKEVDQLLVKGARVNGTGDFGETALMVASRFNQGRTALALLQQGANVDQSDDQDETPLMKASMNCSNFVVTHLLEYRPNVNRINHEGRTALIFAARSGCAFIVHRLLRTNGIDYKVRDFSGKDALDHASEEAIAEVEGPYTTIVNELRAVSGQSFKAPTNRLP